MTQEQALDILKTGANVFLTGEPGAGKTHVTNAYVAWLEAAGVPVAVTASTGIAATHIGGMTIHSWSGIGVRDTLTHGDLEQIAGRERVVKRLEKAQVLIIDEVSMLDAKQLDMVEVVARTVRRSDEAFGGLQVVLVGDFFQLPPVTKQGEVMRYAFISHAWERARPLVCYLHEQYRQADEQLLSLLGDIRRNQIEDDHYMLLSEQTEIAYEDIEPTRLYTHNADVDSVNATRLSELGGPSRTFSMQSTGSKPMVEALVRTCLSPQQLVLREDAMVMCTKNNFEAGYVNGTLGRVVSFDHDDGWPIIETAAGKRVTIRPASWEVAEDGKVKAAIEQVPLRLAWAITVHKSQGMSLDAAEVDLSRSFVYGQGYVALSRVRSLQGLKVLGMHQNALMVDPRVVERDGRFRTESEMAEQTFAELGTEEVVAMHERFVRARGGKMPSAEAVARAAESGGPRPPKKHTTEETLEQLRSGQSVAAVAKVRDLAETTIWGHVEQLAGAGTLTSEEVAALLPDTTEWHAAVAAITAAIAIHGDEKLKPLHEATNEAYGYDTIRLVRLGYRSGVLATPTAG